VYLNSFLDTEISTKNKFRALNLDYDTETPLKQELRLSWSPPKLA